LEVPHGHARTGLRTNTACQTDYGVVEGRARSGENPKPSVPASFGDLIGSDTSTARCQNPFARISFDTL